MTIFDALILSFSFFNGKVRFRFRISFGRGSPVFLDLDAFQLHLPLSSPPVSPQNQPRLPPQLSSLEISSRLPPENELQKGSPHQSSLPNYSLLQRTSNTKLSIQVLLQTKRMHLLPSRTNLHPEEVELLCFHLVIKVEFLVVILCLHLLEVVWSRKRT